MIEQFVCSLYAHIVAAMWAGIGCDMIADGNFVYCAGAASAVKVTYGCLAMRAVFLTGCVGFALSLAMRRYVIFPIALVIALGMSWLRCFVLVALFFRDPETFNVLHGRCGYVVFIASVTVLFMIVAKFFSPRRI